MVASKSIKMIEPISYDSDLRAGEAWDISSLVAPETTIVPKDCIVYENAQGRISLTCRDYEVNNQRPKFESDTDSIRSDQNFETHIDLMDLEIIEEPSKQIVYPVELEMNLTPQELSDLAEQNKIGQLGDYDYLEYDDRNNIVISTIEFQEDDSDDRSITTELESIPESLSKDFMEASSSSVLTPFGRSQPGNLGGEPSGVPPRIRVEPEMLERRYEIEEVVIGSQEGPLQLWNISTKKKLYEFKGWNSPVCTCISSPALDVIAVGCADGTIHVHNIRSDEELFTFTHSTRGAVTSLTFSTDGQPLLAAGGSSGVISVWNLEKRKLQSVIRDAHDGSIVSLHFFANEPVLMSSSADNSIKMWIFDTSDGDPRLLRFKSGHSAPPLCIKFYANGRHILSAGQDRAFRLFSVVQDQQSRELSQRHVSKRAQKLRVKEEEIKLNPVNAFDCAEIRERDWCNVVTCHVDTDQAYVWRLQNFVLGEHILRPCPENPTPVKACTISACGNFAILGTAAGWVERFNLQSGMSRGSYLDVSEKENYAHGGEVVGVACDSTNTLMISAGYHGDIKVWNFKGREIKAKWETGCSLVKIVYHRLNGLLAIVGDDLIIRLFDVVALRMVRKFEGHSDRITDLCFSEDGKWLLSSSMDGTLRIWDVILARQIDAVHVDVAITALSLSPNLDLLATTHVDQNGVYLWVNQLMFSRTSSIDSFASGKHIVGVKLPSVCSGGGAEAEDTDKSDVKQLQTKDLLSFMPFGHQLPDLVTLSLLPKSQWQNLINLDIIKIRNKPIEPPKKPEKAPFFLPSIPSLSGEVLFKPSEQSNEDEDAKSENMENKKKTDIATAQFLQLLHSSAEGRNFGDFTDYIKGLSPSTLDMELRMLQIIDDEDDQLEFENRPELLSIELLLEYFIHEVSCRNNFEFIQALIRLFLKIHGEVIRRHSKLQDKARELLEIQTAVWQRVDKMFQSVRCMVTFLSNSQF